METVVIPCLRRLGNTKKYRVIQLDVVDKISFGRSTANDVEVCLISSMISRKHATLSKTKDSRWQIQDHGSLNGVYVNDKRIPTNTPCVLTDKDIVRLGVPPGDGKEAEFVWQFCKAANVCRNAKKYKQELSRLSSQPNFDSQKTIEGTSQDFDSPDLKRIRSPGDEEPKPGTSGMSPSGRPPIKRMRPGATAVFSPSEAILRKMEEAEEEAKRLREEQESKLAEMAAQMKEKEEQHKMREEEIKKKEEEMKEMMEKMKKDMEEKFAAQQEEMQNEYQQKVQQREAQMRRQLEEEHEKLVSERADIEKKLAEDLSSKFGEEKKVLVQELLAEKDKLDKVIERKECEHKMLREQLDKAKNDFNEQKDLTALKTKEQIMNNISDILETELQCSICNELFVETMTLNCSHAFCAYCLDQWMNVKKDCPVCRAPITSSVRARAVDSYIDKMCEHLSEAMKEERKKLVAERKEEMNKIREAKQRAQQATASPGRRGRRGRGARGGGGRANVRGGRGRAQAALPALPTFPGIPPQVVIIGENGQPNQVIDVTYEESVVNDNVAAVIDVASSESHDSDEDSDRDSFIVSDDENDSDSSVEGDPHAYYGGYGACYRCGRRGHWANGCPDY